MREESALFVQCEFVLPDTKLPFFRDSHFHCFDISHCSVTLHSEELRAQFMVPEQV